VRRTAKTKTVNNAGLRKDFAGRKKDFCRMRFLQLRRLVGFRQTLKESRLRLFYGTLPILLVEFRRRAVTQVPDLFLF
jgi:hypothetical protein